MLKIVTAPNDILSLPAKPVINFDNSLKKLVKEMEKTLLAQKDPKGVGLAAPQVGESLAVFIMKAYPQSSLDVFINPKILSTYTQAKKSENKPPKQSQKKTKQKKILEGCLSIPKIWSPIKRADKVLLQYQDLTGAVGQKWFSGFEAVIIQHEVDHLNGILFTQRALEQKIPLYEEKAGKLEKLEY